MKYLSKVPTHKGTRRQVQGSALALPRILVFSFLQFHVQSMTQRHHTTLFYRVKYGQVLVFQK